MAWEIEGTDPFRDWYWNLDRDEQEAINAAVEALERDGPTLRRPIADRVTSSRHHNMKELRPPLGNIRILFAFDPRRLAILLIGGDKTNLWDEWYRVNVPLADDLYDEHLASLRREGRLP